MTECNRCGDCCDGFYFAPDSEEHCRKWAVWYNEEWLPWALAHPLDGEGDGVAYWKDADFIATHWHRRSDGDMTCDMWDRTSRLCTAHDTRPNVCRGFPWYGGTPYTTALVRYPRCAFWDDLPKAFPRSRQLPVLQAGA